MKSIQVVSRRFVQQPAWFSRGISSIQTTAEGKPETTDYSVYFTQAGKKISPWHALPLKLPNTAVGSGYTFINEIPKNTKAKMEVSTKVQLNPIKQDIKNGKLRFFTYDMKTNGIPFNYGLLPQTFEDPNETHKDTGFKGDADPVDVVEIGAERLPVGSIYEVKVLGTLAMIDEGETDWKLICIRTSDPRAKNLNSIADLLKEPDGEAELNAIRHWFRYYKTSDGKPENTFAFDGKYKDRDYALQIIEEVNHSWKKLLKGDLPNKKGWWLPPPHLS